MPELPEVQNVIDGLKIEVLNKTLKSIDVRYERMIENLDDLYSLIGKTIIDIKRRGKFIIFCYSDNLYLVSHLRMEGKYNYLSKKIPFTKHDHVIFDFGEDKNLRYTDVRKFGIMCVRNEANLFSINPLLKLGYEPFDKKLTADILYKQLLKKKTPIKTSLLDQTIMVGLGNIYVDEVLFAAKVHPKKISNTLSKTEVSAILLATRDILKRAIAAGGTTIYTFTSTHLKPGTYQNYLKVHTKEGELCPVCKTKILKIKVGGRSSYFCPQCQKASE